VWTNHPLLKNGPVYITFDNTSQIFVNWLLNFARNSFSDCYFAIPFKILTWCLSSLATTCLFPPNIVKGKRVVGWGGGFYILKYC